MQARERQYRQDHRAEIAARRRESYDLNRERDAEQFRRWRAGHPDKVAELLRRYRAAHPEKVVEQNRRYYEEHREELAQYQRLYREANPEKVAEKSRLWREAHPAECAATSNRRRARKLNAPGSHTAADVRAQYERQRGRCYWCKKKTGGIHHVDHVIPLTLGGSNGPENLVIACAPCNLRKNAKHPMDFAGVML